LKLKLSFNIILGMASTPPMDSSDAPGIARAMTRCECTELAFEEVIRHMREHGLSLDDVCQQTGCGRLCTACLPDLRTRACTSG